IAIARKAFPQFVNALMTITINERDASIWKETTHVVGHPEHFVGANAFFEILFYENLAAVEVITSLRDLVPVTGGNICRQFLAAYQHIEIFGTVIHLNRVRLFSFHTRDTHFEPVSAASE